MEKSENRDLTMAGVTDQSTFFELQKARNPSKYWGFVVPVVGLLCGDGYRRLPLALRAARPRLPQSRFAAKRRTAAFCGRSVESRPIRAKI